jgi:hypothetical protein
LPKWILYSKNIIDDVPSFLEVDYFTLSLLVLYVLRIRPKFRIVIRLKHF